MTSIMVDGHEYHPTWLRDNCLCTGCRHATSFEKIVDLSTFPSSPRARSVRIENATLVVDWDEQPEHRSVFPAPWLRAHAHDDTDRRRRRPQTLWAANTWGQDEPPSHDMRRCDGMGGEWADDLERYGICFFHSVTEAELDRFATSVGPLLNTEFGDHIVVRAEPDTSDLALTARHLSPHTDFSAHMHTAPLLQFILCLQQRATGGDSIQVDGFTIANELRRASPESFDLLVRTPLGFQQFYANSRYFFRRTRPIIELDRYGDVSGVFFAHSHASGWRLAPDEVDAVYAAYNAFFAMTKDPAYQLRTRMKEGDCVAFRNGRILHGRTGFDPGSGPRTLVDVFVPYDYFDARRNYLRYADAYLPVIGVPPA